MLKGTQVILGRDLKLQHHLTLFNHCHGNYNLKTTHLSIPLSPSSPGHEIRMLEDAGRVKDHNFSSQEYLTFFNHCHVNYKLKTPQSEHPFISRIPGTRDKEAE